MLSTLEVELTRDCSPLAVGPILLSVFLVPCLLQGEDSPFSSDREEVAKCIIDPKQDSMITWAGRHCRVLGCRGLSDRTRPALPSRAWLWG